MVGRVGTTPDILVARWVDAGGDEGSFLVGYFSQVRGIAAWHAPTGTSAAELPFGYPVISADFADTMWSPQQSILLWDLPPVISDGDLPART